MLKRPFKVSKSDYKYGTSIPRLFPSGNFGGGLEVNTGLPAVQSLMIDMSTVKGSLNISNEDILFVLKNIKIIVKANEDNVIFPNTALTNKIIQIQIFKDGEVISNQRYNSMIGFALSAENYTVSSRVSRVDGVLYNMYIADIKIPGDTDGLSMSGADYIKIDALDIIDSVNPIPTNIDNISILAVGFHGYLVIKK